jgi:hypothetical protein
MLYYELSISKAQLKDGRYIYVAIRHVYNINPETQELYGHDEVGRGHYSTRDGIVDAERKIHQNGPYSQVKFQARNTDSVYNS